MEPVVRMLFGSTVYGTNTPDSDTDYKSIALPPARDIILQRAFKTVAKRTGTDFSKNTKNDVDDDTYSLHYFLYQLCQGQTYTFDMLFTPEKFWVSSSPAWEMIQKHRSELMHKEVAAFAGYCQAQAAKYSLKGSNVAAYRLARDFFLSRDKHSRIQDVMPHFVEQVLNISVLETIYHDKGSPIIKMVMIPHKNTGEQEWYIQVGPKAKVPLTASCGTAADVYGRQFDKYGERAKMAETNQGVDFKALSHAVRVCREAEELLLTGHITFPLTDPMVKKIKLGEVAFAQVSEMIEEGLERVKYAQSKSTLPEKPNMAFVESLITEIYGGLMHNFCRIEG